MSYAVSSDIQAEFKSVTFSSVSAITTAQITEWIAQEEAWLNSEVAVIYAVPITGAASISIMKKMTVLQVKARMLDIMEVKSGSGDTDQGEPGDGLREQVRGMLDRIMKRELRLYDATLAVSGGRVSSGNVTNDLTHDFDASIEQW